MERIRGFDKCIARMRDARALDELYDSMTELTEMIGFDRFTLGHDVDLLRPLDNSVRLTNYDPAWIKEQIESQFFFDDPVRAVSKKLVRPFSWDEIPNHIALTNRQKMILNRAKSYDLNAGITIPVHLPGEYEGSCSFAARDIANVHPFGLPLGHTAATFAFESARQLMRNRDGKCAEPIPTFTSKQREMLILVGRGKTDAEIAQVMGVSRSTAHDHVEAGRRAYGNAQRSLMVLRAMYDGIITFSDIFFR